MRRRQNIVWRPAFLALGLAVVWSSIEAQPKIVSFAWAESQARLPFVSCKSDGQLGPRLGPRASGPTPAVAPSLAPQLAYYASQSLGVVAPRGWHCFGLYGSDGATLFVTPQRHDANYFFGSENKLTGSAVQLTLSLEGTSGRFLVARVAARLFPKYRAFVRRIIREGVESASDFPFGPFPHDFLTRRSNDDVEFMTPAMMDGIGAYSRLSKDADPIYGLAIMTKARNLVLLDVRTAREQRQLIPAIIEAARSQHRAFPVEQ